MNKENQQEQIFKKVILSLSIAAFALTACQPTPTQQATEIITTEPTHAGTLAPPETPTPFPTETPTNTQTAAPVFEPWISLEPVASGLTAPVALAAPDDGSERLFIVDQIGLIYIVDGEDNLIETPFLDLQDKLVTLSANYDERGLLGMAFHPAYTSNGRFFVYYSAPLQDGGQAGYNHTNVLSEFRVSDGDPNQADPNSEKIILQIDQPQANHNAGAITFGPDGYLYIPLGDGGSGSDVGIGHSQDWYAANAGGNGQDVENNMLGSILRIDIDKGDPYAVPEDNPNISENFPEIWAYGFRNPYRMAFDPGGDHELFLGDAGQDLWEEVSIVQAGGNYGWNVREGAHCFSTSNPENPNAITDCPKEDNLGNPLIDPIIEFPNSSHPDGGLGTTIIGGVVYRGDLLPAWDGRYLFGQWSTSFRSPQGGLFVATRPEDDSWDFEDVQIANHDNNGLGAYLLALGQDQNGEVYVLTSLNVGPSGNTGSVTRVISP